MMMIMIFLCTTLIQACGVHSMLISNTFAQTDTKESLIELEAPVTADLIKCVLFCNLHDYCQMISYQKGRCQLLGHATYLTHGVYVKGTIYEQLSEYCYGLFTTMFCL